MNPLWLAVLPLIACACASNAPEAGASIRLKSQGSFQAGATPSGQEIDTARIEELTGLKGSLNKTENVFKVTSPRADVPISVDGRVLEPFMGLTSWAGFLPGKKAPCMVMGDLVLFQDEVNPVLSAALDNGLCVTALHNHFLYDEPRVSFMHIAGEGTAEVLARGVRSALDQVKAVRARQPKPATSSAREAVPTKNAVPAEKLDALLGVKGQVKDGMYKAVFGRTVGMSCGCEVGKEMGVNTWSAFAGDADHALVDGDFVTFEGELQPVLKALRHAGIDIVAIHSHMEGETPKAIFLHYWGVGRAEDLAKAVKTALDAQPK